MKSVRVYKQALDDFVLVYVPEAERVYSVDSMESALLPDQVELADEEMRWTEYDRPREMTPSDLVLLLTTACNLGCTYCYSNAGRADHVMSIDVAEKAISFIAESVRHAGGAGFSILFHGEGEPTANWPVLTKSVAFALKHASTLGLQVRFSIATNGAYGSEKRSYVSENIHNITVSMDGPRLIHERQRPRASGASSFDEVIASADYFYQQRHRLNFGLRATILSENISVLPEIVDFFGEKFPGADLSVEPVETLGRYATAPRQAFDGLAFAYREARKRARKHGLRFWYSAVRGPRKTDFFCGVGGRSMVVGPTGLISGCSRVSQWKHAGAQEFIYGQIEASKPNPVHFAHAKLKVESYSGRNMPDCQNCIAYTWCRGDCRHIRYMENHDVLNGVSSRCREIRTIVVGELLDAINDPNADASLKRFYLDAASPPFT
jgi:uncharacterized protein